RTTTSRPALHRCNGTVRHRGRENAMRTGTRRRTHAANVPRCTKTLLRLNWGVNGKDEHIEFRRDAAGTVACGLRESDALLAVQFLRGRIDGVVQGRSVCPQNSMPCAAPFARIPMMRCGN